MYKKIILKAVFLKRLEENSPNIRYKFELLRGSGQTHRLSKIVKEVIIIQVNLIESDFYRF